MWTGIVWEYLPHDFPPAKTVYGYFPAWEKVFCSAIGGRDGSATSADVECARRRRVRTAVCPVRSVGRCGDRPRSATVGENSRSP
ncbi:MULTISPECIES: transposase [Catenuloplanes]|uniref:transposase n=1 Tax=Catenuloplanes TaxID=33874 RepID=UPI0035B53B5B